MLLTITATHRPATDLGYLLHKNPARVHTAERVIALSLATAAIRENPAADIVKC
jgi:hypothetical protein